VTDYTIRDALRAPGLISLVRLPLALAFPWAMDRPHCALALVAGAGASDVLDGWCARRLHAATPTGALLDAVMDKAFVLAVILSLVARGRVGPAAALLLATRDLAEIPLLARLAIVRRLSEPRRPNRLGKLATVLQFGAVAAILAGLPRRELLIATAAFCGALAAGTYWAREAS
jgi:CDP-diacylglycerol--glycerol-3-phosphate 3-phosphatidyltransferase/cardiolipin synthase